jgi:hypothetical protein
MTNPGRAAVRDADFYLLERLLAPEDREADGDSEAEGAKPV